MLNTNFVSRCLSHTHISFCLTKFDHSFMDLLSLYSIYYWVQGGRQQQVQVGYKNVDMMGYSASSKVMSEEVEEGWDIGDHNSTYVWCTSTEGFMANICRRQLYHSMDNHGKRHGDTEHIKAPNKHSSYKTIDSINLNITTRVWPQPCGHNRYGGWGFLYSMEDTWSGK